MKLQIKTFLLTAVFILFSLGRASAQTPATLIGIKTGLNFSTFNASVTKPVIDHFAQEPWFYAGVQAQLGVGKNFSIQPELFWVGNRQQVYLNTPYAIREEDLNQLSLPILAKYHLGKVALYTGPQFDFLLSAKDNAGQSKNGYKKISFNAVIGAEWVFKYRFGIETRYVFGLSNMATSNGEADVTSQANQNLKINALQAGLFFRIGKKPLKEKK
jgi:hypothetical protein